MARLLFVHPRRASFIVLDRELLAEHHELEDRYQAGRWANPIAVLASVLRNDAVVAWWASWHSFWPITIAWLLRRPSVLIVGGFDTACEPQIGYGYQQGGVRRQLARWIMRRAGVLATNSEYSRGEIERNCEIAAERVTVVHHGVPDTFGEPDGGGGPRERVALTVGVVDRANLERKGLALFVETAARLPDVRFVVIGRDGGGAAALRALAGPNVELRGFVSDDELRDAYRTAAVYVQASQHEGFGVSVTEAMLAGCVPVVTPAGALPEVVADAGIVTESSDLAAAVERALAAGPDGARRARERVLSAFPVSARAAGLDELVERAIAQRPRRRRR